MATIRDIIRDIQDELPDGSLSVGRILALINEGARDIAVGEYPQYNIPSINLKSLEKVADVAVTERETDLSTVGVLTDEYCKGLISASISGSPIVVLASSAQLERYYPGLASAGTPEMVAMSGKNLVCAPYGTATITIQYFAYPPVYTTADTPDFLPDNLQMRLLKNYVLKELPTKYLDGIAFNPSERFAEAIMQLFGTVGVYSPKPAPTHNPVWDHLDNSQC